MKKILIVTGGRIEDTFVLEWLRKNSVDKIVAGDSGVNFFYRNRDRIMPDIILGDFDSVNKDAIDYYRNKTEIPIKDFPPEKDETDTELAIRTAIEMGAEEIILFGATGTRVDHLLGNIQLLSLGLQTGVDCQIVDANNRIRLLTKDMVLTKAEQFGDRKSVV